VLKNGAVFSSQTIGPALWIKDGNVFGISIASQGAFRIDLENSQYFFGWMKIAQFRYYKPKRR